MERQPNPDDPAYRDKSTKKKLDSKKTKTPGQRLEDSGQYLKDPETEDLSKGSLMIKQAGPDYAGEKAKVGTFDRDMEAYRKAQKKGNLTAKDRIRILGDNAKNYGRLAIRANPTGMVLPIATGAASLLIKSMQQQLMGVN